MVIHLSICLRVYFVSSSHDLPDTVLEEQTSLHDP